MKVQLHDKDGNVVRTYELPADAHPTPTVIIDGETNIMYKLLQSGNHYDCYPVNYHIIGGKSEAMIDRDGKMYWGSEEVQS